MTVALLWMLISVSGCGYNCTGSAVTLSHFVKLEECERVRRLVVTMNNAKLSAQCIQAEVVVVK
jgi:hypothetical protein